MNEFNIPINLKGMSCLCGTRSAGNAAAQTRDCSNSAHKLLYTFLKPHSIHVLKAQFLCILRCLWEGLKYHSLQ